MKARVPGSVTVIFAPVDGSALGVSFAIADGVVAAVDPADGTQILLNGDPTEFEPVEIALDDLGVDAQVDLTAEVPVARGFGASGAATLGTVLAANRVFGLDREREVLVEAAARAERKAGTGLADVYVQERGGCVYNTGAGLRRTVREDPLRYDSWGEIATPDVLGDEAALERVRATGRDALAAFEPEMPLPALLDLAWSFADAAGFATDAVRDRVQEVRAAGGAATQAMVGETVIGTVDANLPEQTQIDPEGARLV